LARLLCQYRPCTRRITGEIGIWDYEQRLVGAVLRGERCFAINLPEI
jgi:hypothetical protein